MKLMNNTKRPQKIICAANHKGSISHAKKEFERLKDSTENVAEGYPSSASRAAKPQV